MDGAEGDTGWDDAARRLTSAIAEDRLGLCSQPIVNLATRTAHADELLLRLTEDGREPIPAAAFIRSAESAGMVGVLDRWVVSQAIELAAERAGSGSERGIHVNLSGASVIDIDVLEFIEREIDESDADPALLTFEITETVAISDFATAARFADRICEFGCQVAIDDYGAGLGPFRYIRLLPFDIIKIDGEFVQDLLKNDADRLAVQAMVDIARGLGKATIAEFVQDEETAELLHSYGVDFAQGHHFGAPVPLTGQTASLTR